MLPKPKITAIIPAKIFQYLPNVVCATWPTKPATAPISIKETIVPNINHRADLTSALLVVSVFVPEYPATKPMQEACSRYLQLHLQHQVKMQILADRLC